MDDYLKYRNDNFDAESMDKLLLNDSIPFYKILDLMGKSIYFHNIIMESKLRNYCREHDISINKACIVESISATERNEKRRNTVLVGEARFRDTFSCDCRGDDSEDLIKYGHLVDKL